MQPTLDLASLRSLVAVVDLGSVTSAADRLFRSTSAVSAQIKKLEEQIGAPLFRKVGRGLALTDAGEAFLSYARRMLDLNDEAMISARGHGFDGLVRIGIQEDFGEALLPKTLRRFAKAHPLLKIEVRIGRNAVLSGAVARGELDLALIWDHDNPVVYKTPIKSTSIRWIGSPTSMNDLRAGNTPVPLIVLEGACHFRTLATSSLDRLGRPWRLALTSPSLAGVWAGVAAGLGVTVRTAFGLPRSSCVFDPVQWRLPEFGSLDLAILRREPDLGPVCELLVEMMIEEIATLDGGEF